MKMIRVLIQVLDLMAHGHPVRTIALHLGLSIKTVGTYRARLMDKLQLPNMAQLIRFALLDNDQTSDSSTPPMTVANHEALMPVKAAVPVAPPTVPVSSSRRDMEPMEWPG